MSVLDIQELVVPLWNIKTFFLGNPDIFCICLVIQKQKVIHILFFMTPSPFAHILRDISPNIRTKRVRVIKTVYFENTRHFAFIKHVRVPNEKGFSIPLITPLKDKNAFYWEPWNFLPMLDNSNVYFRRLHISLKNAQKGKRS